MPFRFFCVVGSCRVVESDVQCTTRVQQQICQATNECTRCGWCRLVVLSRLLVSVRAIVQCRLSPVSALSLLVACRAACGSSEFSSCRGLFFFLGAHLARASALDASMALAFGIRRWRDLFAQSMNATRRSIGVTRRDRVGARRRTSERPAFCAQNQRGSRALDALGRAVARTIAPMVANA